jgi:uncharacterized protein YutE (UPF0331/DUF86 family)
MTNRLLVLRKLARLRERLAQARARRPPSPEALHADAILLDALALSVMVALQEAIDVAFHVCTDEGWGVPASYGESFELLANRGVLDLPIARAMTSAAALRNRIAHAYASVDVERFWHQLPTGLEALERFSESVARWLGPGVTEPAAG